VKFHHIGIACEEIPDSMEEIKKIYNVISTSPICYDPLQKSTLCLLSTDNGLSIELISGEMVKNIHKKGIIYYHLCFSVPDIDIEFKRLIKQGLIPVSSPKSSLLFKGQKVGFLYSKCGLIELLEDQV